MSGLKASGCVRTVASDLDMDSQVRGLKLWLGVWARRNIGGKWTGWERSTRVPLIIAPPKSLAKDFAPAGSRCDQPVGLIDLFPTLTDLCGVEPPKGLDGQSLVPLLRDPAKVTGRRLITTFDPGNYSVRSERWRYILYADGNEELYDLKADPNEWENLAGKVEVRDVVVRMRGDL